VGFVLVKSTGWVDGQTQVRRGDCWADDDPIVTAHPDMFTTDPEGENMLRSSQDVITRSVPAGPVEQATAAPGEVRQTQIDPRTSTRPRSGK
jgi:hypothetical protein